MFQQKDEAHLKAIAAMPDIMKSQELMQEWFDSKKIEFDSLDDN